jgi:ribose transport system substrate-binding protein
VLVGPRINPSEHLVRGDLVKSPPIRASLVIIAALAVLATACGSDSDSNDADAAGTDSGQPAGAAVQAAESYIADYLTEPTDFPVSDAPLSRTPDKKEVGFVVCPDPACVELAKYIEDATDALGWDLQSVNANDWSDPGSAIQQLIDADVDYIGLTGFPMAQYQPQMEAMKAKGIPLFQSYVTDEPAGEANNLYHDGYDAKATEVYAGVISNWVIADSGGDADVVIVTLGTTPILDAQVAAAEETFETNCPDCSVEVVTGTQNDLVTGAMPQMVTSYLQTNPDTNYVYFAYSSLAEGAVSAFKSAGVFDQVKIVGTQGFAPQFQEIIDGTAAAWTALPAEFSMWTMVDQMARYAVDEWSLELEREAAIPPLYIVSSGEQAEAIVDLAAGWPGPDGFKDTFKELWGV